VRPLPQLPLGGAPRPADYVAGVNIAKRAATAWVFVNMPKPAPA
jgi:putative transposase